MDHAMLVYQHHKFNCKTDCTPPTKPPQRLARYTTVKEVVKAKIKLTPIINEKPTVNIARFPYLSEPNPPSTDVSIDMI